jgi:hypothetical protein
MEDSGIGKWEEKDLSDREMRLMARAERGSLRRTPCKVVHDCCLDSLQGATASIDEPAALWWDVWRCSEWEGEEAEPRTQGGARI